MFEQFEILRNVIILIVALVVLDKASDVTINNSVKVVDVTGFGKTTVGFILYNRVFNIST